MISERGRQAASGLHSRARGLRCLFLTTLVFPVFLFGLLLPQAARAVVVRGRVTDALGRAVPGARVQLIENGKVAAIAYAGADGSYEIRSTESGRFTLLGSEGGFLPAIGQEFYGGAVDVVAQDVVLSATTVKQEISVTATGVPTPLEQLTAPVTLIPENKLATRVGVVSELRQVPGVQVEQTGQAGAVTSLFVRGGPSDGNKVLIDGIPAEDVGGVFDYGTVSSTGVGSVEIYRSPNSALYGSDSQAGVVSITTPHGTTLAPLLTYSGDAGTLHAWRNEATLGGTVSKLDYFAGYSRFDMSNALPNDRFHASTAVMNLGYNLIDGVSLRFTLRDGVSAQGLPNAYDFYNVTQDGKEADQDLYSGLTIEDRTKSDWHNLLRYGIARKREQANFYGNQGTLTTINDPIYGPFDAYVGNVVTIRGANGYTATGQAQFFSTDRDQDSNRDELYYQTDYTFPKRITALFGFRYDNERGSYNSPGPYGEHEQIHRTNYEGNLQFQGDIKSRLFYSLGGSVEKNHLYGYAGEPRLGLAYVPVRPGNRMFQGTKLRANLSTGVQEPSLATEFVSLYRQLLESGDTTDIQLFGIQPLGPERSRSADFGVEQNIWRQTLVLSVDYFHNAFSHQLEDVGSQDLETYFGFAPTDPNVYLYGAELNSMAYRAQGAEVELQWQPRHHLFVRGGYTYLDAVVLQSFTGDVTAAMQGMPTENPNLPGIAIGGVSPLVGARPFRRPPHTGFFNINYTRTRFSATISAALASRADDSTYLTGLDTVDGNSLLLPNRDLDFGYAKLDVGGTYVLRRNVTAFAQADNLLNDQHIGPIGYPGLPLTVRVGLKLRLGGD
jgi:iron complex outermembrane receptor protein/vitamin B12 transporter